MGAANRIAAEAANRIAGRGGLRACRAGAGAANRIAVGAPQSPEGVRLSTSPRTWMSVRCRLSAAMDPAFSKPFPPEFLPSHDLDQLPDPHPFCPSVMAETALLDVSRRRRWRRGGRGGEGRGGEAVAAARVAAARAATARVAAARVAAARTATARVAAARLGSSPCRSRRRALASREDDVRSSDNCACAALESIASSSVQAQAFATSQ